MPEEKTHMPPQDAADRERSGDRRLSTCSLVVGCSEDVEEFRARKPHRRFKAWKGRDVWHQNISVQIRLDDDGSVFLSTQEGHVSTLRIATITLEKLHATIRGIIAENAGILAQPTNDSTDTKNER